MFASNHHTAGIAGPEQGAGHKCLPCLRSADPRKRDCAIRHLRADGYRTDGSEAHRPDPTPQQ